MPYDNLQSVALNLFTDLNSGCFTKVRAPVHIITGSAGCKEGRDTFKHNPSPWSAFRSQDYGYTKFKAFNRTHIYMEQISVEQTGQSIDSFWLVKNRALRFH